MVRAGVFPSSPLRHNHAFSTRTLHLFHDLFCRCPRLSIQPFIKSLCDVQGLPFKPYLMQQFSSAYDAYLEVRSRIRKLVAQALGRDSPTWRILHACPCCQNELEEDDPLEIRMMVAMDGNDSLKRVERHKDAADDSLAEVAGSGVVERTDPRQAGGDYFISRVSVDEWAEENWKNAPVLVPQDSFRDWVWKTGRCEEKWHNASDKNTGKSWAKFDENGIFLLICRHGLVLSLSDMVKSGEKAKYSLAAIYHFLEAERQHRVSNGEEAPPKGKLCFSYDVGCTNSKTVHRSPLASLAKYMGYLPAVGTMHGYAHERACQLNFLLLYQSGAGLEDGETSEQCFSKSNSLASATRHASIFHRRQMITEYAYHTDNFETYGNLSKFLRNHYIQALEILRTAPSLRIRMHEAGIKDARVIFQWMKEEAAYLQNLSREPPSETLQMEYYGKLVALKECQAVLKDARHAWLSYRPGEHDQTLALERAQRHAQENERKILADVHALEMKLDVRVRWTEGSKQWEEAGSLVTGAKYRRALDKLEGLLVSRIFELSRLNISGTGYKMRKHLASALKKRSKSIQSAIVEYNTVAGKMKPKRRQVDWEEVVEYAFLSEFDILRDTREDIRERPWAVPANRVIITQFFKVIGAEDELSRVHQEIRRLITYMQRERDELIAREQELIPTNPTLALQVRDFRRERGRFHEVHKKRLLSITKLSGFDWSTNGKYFFPGTPLERSNFTNLAVGASTADRGVEEDNNTDDDEEEEEDEELVLRIDAFLSVATDVLEK
ncbi:uncharacterized protein C8R40DRAFT_1037146 [Lentinula edodes]|uniref:uncharacterized protein n=1 Tax=Lentinula edodes TaxID=5353 RepID=UPI001E8E6A38|nr:uncharacterized protein C8R40DRAFT_1037146 [Lentinula edodes]KAH7878911.1 hypothetical protein C8R40DRAFT_1037146 [Lentinula edodes]